MLFNPDQTRHVNVIPCIMKIIRSTSRKEDKIKIQAQLFQMGCFIKKCPKSAALIDISLFLIWTDG